MWMVLVVWRFRTIVLHYTSYSACCSQKVSLAMVSLLVSKRGYMFTWMPSISIVRGSWRAAFLSKQLINVVHLCITRCKLVGKNPQLLKHETISSIYSARNVCKPPRKVDLPRNTLITKSQVRGKKNEPLTGASWSIDRKKLLICENKNNTAWVSWHYYASLKH